MTTIMVTFPLSGQNESALLEDNVIYRPDLPAKNVFCWARAVAASKPTIVITRRQELHRLALALASLRRCIVVVVERPRRNDAELLTVPSPHQIVYAEGESDMQAEREAFALAEAAHTQSLPLDVPSAPTVLPERRKVVLIGAGIVNLITAVELAGCGYQLAIYDQGPPPDETESDWRDLGATFGGGDGRIYSFNESRHHHASGPDYAEDSNTQFRRGIADSGWLSRTPDNFSPSEEAWVATFERVPPWLQSRYDADIIRFNKEGHPWWSALEREHPELFADVGFRKPLYRVYQARQKFDRARWRESALGTVLEEISLERVQQELPALAEAVRTGQVAGALKVIGFSVNIHAFARALIQFLTARGASFHWRRRLTRISCDAEGRVAAVELDGESIAANDYVVSLGAYGLQIPGLETLQSQIGAVMGMWLTVPNTPPQLDVPLKVGRRDFACDSAAEGANIIPGVDRDGRSVLHCSSGHGFLGMNPYVAEPAAVEELARCIRETAAGLFPDKYALVAATGALEEEPRYCVRPWTASGLGLFCIRSTTQGGAFIYTGGHNTGGFSQSPAVAKAVAAALAGQRHPMHSLYHLERCTRFVLQES